MEAYVPHRFFFFLLFLYLIHFFLRGSSIRNKNQKKRIYIDIEISNLTKAFRTKEDFVKQWDQTMYGLATSGFLRGYQDTMKFSWR